MDSLTAQSDPRKEVDYPQETGEETGARRESGNTPQIIYLVSDGAEFQPRPPGRCRILVLKRCAPCLSP